LFFSPENTKAQKHFKTQKQSPKKKKKVKKTHKKKSAPILCPGFQLGYEG
jgi:hypothetical protein